MKLTVEAICTGTARPFHGVETSAIAKRPREGIVQILEEGFAPDEQADRRVHGGPEMAIHLYPLDHHEFWREQFGAINLLDEPGAFGSNLAVCGLTESDVHIGDRFRLGSALIEISQPRQPCWKIERRFEDFANSKGMVAKIVSTGRCGWYFRVLEIGHTQVGDTLERVEVGHEDWSVLETFEALIAGKASHNGLEQLANLSRLAPKLRAKAKAKLG
ncbi:MOSC domain-containing protein [Erythrobacter sp. THAF29]|uniref:MOSC domain-containing protein n=1 Tax=Erythrobacter sp. THAF29 TaxID=2587851 RepID=UPI00126913EB|nr:MOSC domain-containing protein [Erythrobacter sp. THAF29]QFT78211.1 6-N-hydroxylaminopurine resistance protein [Erythrobacter sp. THAF29]